MIRWALARLQELTPLQLVVVVAVLPVTTIGAVALIAIFRRRNRR